MWWASSHHVVSLQYARAANAVGKREQDMQSVFVLLPMLFHLLLVLAIDKEKPLPHVSKYILKLLNWYLGCR